MQLLNFFATDWGLLRFAAGFVFLPLLYLRECCLMHKALAEIFEKLCDDKFENGCVTPTEIENLATKLYVFDLSAWLTLAVTILLAGVFVLGDIAQFSDLLDDKQKNNAFVRGMLNVFGLAVTLGAAAYIEWSKFDVYRTIQVFWRDQARYHANSTSVAAAAE